MRKLIFVILPSVIVMSACGSKSSSNHTGTSDSTNVSESADDALSAKRYEIKSGIVYYKPVEIMKGIKTTDILYFDDYGRKEAKESVTETNIMGIKNKERKMSMMVDGYTISYEIEKIESGKDVTSKDAYKMKISSDMMNMAMSFAGTNAEEIKKQFDYKEEGTETVAGVKGTKYSIAMNKNMADQRIYGVIYKNIPLKTNMANISIEAEKIEENASVPASKFEVPAGYKIIETSMEDMMKGISGGK